MVLYDMALVERANKKFKWNKKGKRAHIRLARIMHTVAAGLLEEISDIRTWPHIAGWRGAAIRDGRGNQIDMEILFPVDLSQPVLIWACTGFPYVEGLPAYRALPVPAMEPGTESSLWTREDDWGLLTKVWIGDVQDAEVVPLLFKALSSTVESIVAYIEKNDPELVDIGKKVGHPKPVVLKLLKNWSKRTVMDNL